MKEEMQKALEVLREGGVILYPTDTVWGIALLSGTIPLNSMWLIWMC